MKAPQLLLLVLLGFLVICSLTTAWYFSTAACLSDDADELYRLLIAWEGDPTNQHVAWTLTTTLSGVSTT